VNFLKNGIFLIEIPKFDEKEFGENIIIRFLSKEYDRR